MLEFKTMKEFKLGYETRGRDLCLSVLFAVGLYHMIDEP